MCFNCGIYLFKCVNGTQLAHLCTRYNYFALFRNRNQAKMHKCALMADYICSNTRIEPNLHIITLYLPNVADFAIEVRSKCTNVLQWWNIFVQMRKWNTTGTSMQSLYLLWLISQQKFVQNAQMCFDGGLYLFKCVIWPKLAHLF